MKKIMLFLAAFLLILAPVAAAQEMSVTWEWLLDDPEVNFYRYQLDGTADDGWTVVDGSQSSYTVDGLDPYSSYTLYLQRSYDGVYWSASAEAVAEALLEVEVPESADITPVFEDPAVEEEIEVAPEADEIVVSEETAAVEETPALEDSEVIEPAAEAEVVETEAEIEVPAEEIAETEVVETVAEAEPVEETAEAEVAPVLEAPVVELVAEVAPEYVAEEPVEEPLEAIGEVVEDVAAESAIGEEELAPVEDEALVAIGEAESEVQVEDDTLLVEPEVAPVEEAPADDTIVEPAQEEVPAEEPAAEAEELPAPEPEPAMIAEEPAEKKNDFRFSILLKGGVGLPLDFENGIHLTPALHGDFALDFANILPVGNSCGFGLRTDLVSATAVPNRTGWSNQIQSASNFFNIRSYMYTYDPALYVTFDGMAGIVNFNLGLGFSFGMVSPNAIDARTDQWGYNQSLNFINREWAYKLAPAAVLGMRFYCGDVFSIGIEGAYRATVGDWLHHDVTADIVMGFSF